MAGNHITQCFQFCKGTFLVVLFLTAILAPMTTSANATGNTGEDILVEPLVIRKSADLDGLSYDDQLKMIRFRSPLNATLFMGSGKIFDLNIEHASLQHIGNLPGRSSVNCYDDDYTNCVFRGDYYDGYNRFLIILCSEHSGVDRFGYREIPDDCVQYSLNSSYFSAETNPIYISSGSTTYSTQMGTVLVENNSIMFLDTNEKVCCTAHSSADMMQGGHWTWGPLPDATGTRWMSGIGNPSHHSNGGDNVYYSLEKLVQITNNESVQRNFEPFVSSQIDVPDSRQYWVAIPTSNSNQDYCLQNLLPSPIPSTGNYYNFQKKILSPLDVRISPHPHTLSSHLHTPNSWRCSFGGLDSPNPLHDHSTGLFFSRHVRPVDRAEEIQFYDTVGVSDVDIQSGNAIMIHNSHVWSYWDYDDGIQIDEERKASIELYGLESEIGHINFASEGDQEIPIMAVILAFFTALVLAGIAIGSGWIDNALPSAPEKPIKSNSTTTRSYTRSYSSSYSSSRKTTTKPKEKHWLYDSPRYRQVYGSRRYSDDSDVGDSGSGLGDTGGGDDDG